MDCECGLCSPVCTTRRSSANGIGVINPTLYYGWKRRLLSSAAKVFGEPYRQASAKAERLAEENATLESVVVETTTKNLKLTKGLSD